MLGRVFIFGSTHQTGSTSDSDFVVSNSIIEFSYVPGLRRQAVTRTGLNKIP